MKYLIFYSTTGVDARIMVAEMRKSTLGKIACLNAAFVRNLDEMAIACGLIVGDDDRVEDALEILILKYVGVSWLAFDEKRHTSALLTYDLSHMENMTCYERIAKENGFFQAVIALGASGDGRPAILSHSFSKETKEMTFSKKYQNKLVDVTSLKGSGEDVMKIVNAVAEKYETTPENICKAQRINNILQGRARPIAIYLTRVVSGLKLEAIGDIFNCNYSSVCSISSKIDRLLKTSASLREDVDELFKTVTKKVRKNQDVCA